MFQGVPRLILDISFDDDSFTYIDKSEILMSLMMSENQFLDCCLMAGSFFGKTNPYIAEIAKKENDKKVFSCTCFCGFLCLFEVFVGCWLFFVVFCCCLLLCDLCVFF